MQVITSTTMLTLSSKRVYNPMRYTNDVFTPEIPPWKPPEIPPSVGATLNWGGFRVALEAS